MIFYGLYNERYGCWCIWCFFNGLKWCQWIWYGLIWFKLVYNILWLYGQDVLMLMLMDLSWLIWLLCGRYGGRAEISFWNWSWIEVVGSRIQISLKKHCLNMFLTYNYSNWNHQFWLSLCGPLGLRQSNPRCWAMFTRCSPRASNLAHSFWNCSWPGHGQSRRLMSALGLHDPQCCHRESPKILPLRGKNSIFQHVAVGLSAPNEAMAEPETPTPNSPSHAAEPRHLGGPVPLIETENLSKPEAIPGFPERLVIALAVQNPMQKVQFGTNPITSRQYTGCGSYFCNFWHKKYEAVDYGTLIWFPYMMEAWMSYETENISRSCEAWLKMIHVYTCTPKLDSLTSEGSNIWR